MKSRFYLLLALACGMLVAADIPPPAAAGAVDWRFLLKINRLTLPGTWDISPVTAFVPDAPADLQALVWEGPPANIRWEPRLSGELELSIAYLAGGDFVPLALTVNGEVIGQTPLVESAAPVLTMWTVRTPRVAPMGNRLIIEPVGGGRGGLVYVDHRPVAWGTVPREAFTIARKAETVAATTCLTAVHGGSICWLRTTDDARLAVNGTELTADDEGRYRVGPLLLGANRLTLTAPAGVDWRLEVNAQSGFVFGRDFPAVPTEHPTVTLTNGLVSAVCPLPDPERGYYRGPRFQPAGMITRLEHAGHNYVVEFPLNGNPLEPRVAAGTASEFSTPVGYDKAAEGDLFLKVGIGLLRKPFEMQYSFGTNYEIVQPLPYTWDATDNAVTFRQELADFRGWGYVHTKRLEVLPGRPVLVIENTLRNTGRRRLRTSEYCHNFFGFDNEPIDDQVSIEFDFPVTVVNEVVLPRMVRAGDRFTFSGRALFSPLVGGYSATANAATVRHRGKGLQVVTETDFTPFRCCLYADSRCVAPEAFIWLDLPPAQSRTWRRVITLSANAD